MRLIADEFITILLVCFLVTILNSLILLYCMVSVVDLMTQ